MMIRNLLLNSQRDFDETYCIHCGVEKKEAGEGIYSQYLLQWIEVCSNCCFSIFQNDSLPHAYKYCLKCKVFHYYFYFINPTSGRLMNFCMNDTVDVQLKSILTYGCLSVDTRIICECNEKSTRSSKYELYAILFSFIVDVLFPLSIPPCSSGSC